MKLKDGRTPKQGAATIAMEWLRHAFNGKTSDIRDMTTTPAQARELRRQAAKLHNILLQHSGLDGLPLDEEVEH